LANTLLRAEGQACQRLKSAGISVEKEIKALDLLRWPEIHWQQLLQVLDMPLPTIDFVGAQVEIQAKYQGYLERQQKEVEGTRRRMKTLIPSQFNYEKVSGLSAELKQKCQSVRPDSIDQASRIPGMTPAAISLLLVYIKKHLAIKDCTS